MLIMKDFKTHLAELKCTLSLHDSTAVDVNMEALLISHMMLDKDSSIICV